MKLDLIDSTSKSVERFQLGRIPVRQESPIYKLTRSGYRANTMQFGRTRRRQVADDRICGEEIEIAEVGWLVEDLIGRMLHDHRLPVFGKANPIENRAVVLAIRVARLGA
jgi:hypothetical protein